MGFGKTTEGGHEVQSMKRREKNKDEETKKHWVTWLGGLFGGIAAILSLVFGIYKFYVSGRPDLEPYYYKLSGHNIAHLDEIRTSAFKDLGVAPRIADNDCLRQARNRSSAEVVAKKGESIIAAYFLLLRNAGKAQIREIALSGTGEEVNLKGLPPKGAFLICYRLDLRDEGAPSTTPTQAVVSSGDYKRTIPLKPPDEKTTWTLGQIDGVWQAYPPDLAPDQTSAGQK